MDIDTAIVGGLLNGATTDIIRAEYLRSEGIQLDYLTTTNMYWLLMANRLARIKGLQQLGDKMIAVTRHSATDYLTDLHLAGVKTSADVFRVQINNVSLRYDMLVNNEMDAVWLPEPFATKARLQGHVPIADSRHSDENFGVLAVSSKIKQTEEGRRQLESFCKAYNSACDSINKRGVSAYAGLIAKWCEVDISEADSLPSLHYSHVSQPQEEQVAKARDFVEKWKKTQYLSQDGNR